MSSTVNIISETIKNTLSIPIQSLVSRPRNFEELTEEDKKNDDDSESSYSNAKEAIDVVFILVDNFNGKETVEGEKYAIVKPVDTGLSSEIIML